MQRQQRKEKYSFERTESVRFGVRTNKIRIDERMSDTERKDVFKDIETAIDRLKQRRPDVAELAAVSTEIFRKYQRAQLDAADLRLQLDIKTIENERLEKQVDQLQAKIAELEAASRVRLQE
jgi:hypothetical protein